MVREHLGHIPWRALSSQIAAAEASMEDIQKAVEQSKHFVFRYFCYSQKRALMFHRFGFKLWAEP